MGNLKDTAACAQLITPDASSGECKGRVSLHGGSGNRKSEGRTIEVLGWLSQF